MKKCLEIGCGLRPRKIEGYEMYYTDYIKRDVPNFTLCNLNRHPYPFPSNEFDLIITQHTFEHLVIKTTKGDLWPNFFYELSRMLKNGGRINFIVPHFSFAPTLDHSCLICVTEFFNYFKNEHNFSDWQLNHKKHNLKMINIKVKLAHIWKPFENIINLNQRTIWFWEVYLAYIIRGEFIYLTLKKENKTIKNNYGAING
jgi:SAM-dependent methyltransferase